jgi:hypothetical protein
MNRNSTIEKSAYAYASIQRKVATAPAKRMVYKE